MDSLDDIVATADRTGVSTDFLLSAVDGLDDPARARVLANIRAIPPERLTVPWVLPPSRRGEPL